MSVDPVVGPVATYKMHRWGLLVVLIACGGDDPAASDGGPGGGSQDGGNRPDAPGGIGEPAGLVGITLLHNKARANVVTVNPLPAMQWDPSLAATAAAWAAQCRDQDVPIGLIDHNPDRSDGHPYYIGENVFGSGGATPEAAVGRWMKEQPNYNYDANTCTGICGHYTQIVWRTSVKLGCAIGSCPGHMYPSSIVCNYGPGGNDGSRPY